MSNAASIIVELRDGRLFVDGTLVPEFDPRRDFPRFIVGMEVAKALKEKAPQLLQERRRGKRGNGQNGTAACVSESA